MELNITKLFNEIAPMDYSASAVELGQDAGRITWNNAYDDADDYPLLQTDEQREAFRDHVRGFGAWDDEEIAAWSDQELGALLLQLIAGDIRDVPGMDTASWDWTEYQALCEAGTVASNLFLGNDGQVYYYVGS